MDAISITTGKLSGLTLAPPTTKTCFDEPVARVCMSDAIDRYELCEYIGRRDAERLVGWLSEVFGLGLEAKPEKP